MDPNLSNLLKWSLANSTPTTDPSTTNAPPPPTTNPALPTSTPSALAALLSASGSTDADHMRSSLTTITGPTTPATPLSSKLTAFTDLHYLLESLDNANNLSPLHLWPPLVAQLHSPEPEIRRMAAACVGTAVQNNAIAQESVRFSFPFLFLSLSLSCPFFSRRVPLRSLWVSSVRKWGDGW